MLLYLMNMLSGKLLIAGTLFDRLWQDVFDKFISLCLSIDSIIYGGITWMYTVFIAIAEARIFTTETIMSFIQRLYLIVGVIALFFAAYLFLTIIVNPDNLKAGASPAKLIRNVVLGIVSIVFVPTIFNFAYAIQGAVIRQNVIPRLFFESSSLELAQSENSFAEFGVTIFESSFYMKRNELEGSKVRDTYATNEKDAIKFNDIKYFSDCLDYVKDGSIQYNYILSGIIGIVVLFILVSYCINTGVRTVKLCFLQIMAPIPCLLMMVPTQEKVFKSWLSECIKTFLDVFAKIAVMVFGIYLIQRLQVFFDLNRDNLFKNYDISVVCFAKLFLIMGVCMFLKKAPKLMSDIIGIDLTDSGLSLKKTFGEFKESIAPVTNFADRTAGLIGGTIAANQAYKEGLQQGNKGNALKKGLATFHGMRNGWNGGLKNIGAAYNYEMETQRSYALDKNKPLSRQIGNAVFDSLRDNLGFNSRYDDEIRRREISRDVRLADAYRDYREIENKTSEQNRRIENDYKATLNANKNARDKFSTFGDDVKAECEKDGNKAFSTNNEMLAAKRNELFTDRTKVVSDLKSTSLTPEQRKALENKRDQINNDLYRLSLADSYFKKQKTGMDEFNNFQLNNKLEELKTDDTLSQDLKNALTLLYSSGKDQNILKYLSSGDISSKIKMDLQEAELSLRNANVGVSHVYNSSTKTVTQNKEDLLTQFSRAKSSGDFKTILKLKKKLGEIFDQDTMAKNEQLSDTPISVSIGGNPPRKYQLYDLLEMQEQLKQEIETINKEVEKFIEARKSEQQAAQIRQNRDKNRPVFKSHGNNNGKKP